MSVYLRDAGGTAFDGQHDECWVPCAEGDPGAVEFAPVAAARDLLAFVQRIANRNPVFAKGHDKVLISDAQALVAKAVNS